MLISVQDLIKKSYNLYTQNTKFFLIYTTLIFSPYIVLNIFLKTILYKISGYILITNNYHTTPLYTIIHNILQFILPIVYILTFWFSIVFIKSVSDRYNKKNIESVTKVLFDTKKLIIPTLIIPFSIFIAFYANFMLVAFVTLTSVIFGLLSVFMAALAAIVPATIIITQFGFSPYIIILEGMDGLKAFNESKKMVKGRSVDIFFKIFIPLIPLIIIYSAIYLIVHELDKGMIGTNDIIKSFAFIIYTILTSFFITHHIILYNELKDTKKV